MGLKKLYKDDPRGCKALRSIRNTPAMSKYMSLQIGGREYLLCLEPQFLLPQKPVMLIAMQKSSCVDGYMPVTVINHSKDRQALHSMESIIREFSDIDDVFSKYFLCGVILNISATESWPISIRAKDKEYLRSIGCSTCIANKIVASKSNFIPEGPYLMKGRSLYQIWRLYPDTNEAFNLAVVQSSLSSNT
jgi:hypothetical protein